MRKMYTEISLFAVPAIFLASEYFLVGAVLLTIINAIYYVSGGRYGALNFDKKIAFRITIILSYGICISFIDNAVYEILAFLFFVPILFFMLKPVEKYLKQ